MLQTQHSGEFFKKFLIVKVKYLFLTNTESILIKYFYYEVWCCSVSGFKL